MSNIDKRALREAAEKATPGRWEYYPGNTSIEYNVDSMDEDQGSILYVDSGDFTQKQTDLNGAFIAAANPATVLALLDEIAELEQRHCGTALLEREEMHTKTLGRMLDELDAKDRRIAELESDNAYIRNRHKELDLLIGKNILVMQAAIIEWQGTGDAKKGLAWIYNTLFGPGELPDESEKDAQAYFDRKYAPLDEELMNLHRWFWEQSEAERTAAAGKGE
ncbi:ead/Ea22-like family protein [Enterobacter roggenkampii]|uniref:ead/Ea22-like family protein n=1 Tax=Enterobacter roggenkampii TaxID=1812935 RepID=UPI003F43171F